MKKLTKSEINALGKAQREVYLSQNPHGFNAATKCHESKKKYKRNKKHKNNE